MMSLRYFTEYTLLFWGRVSWKTLETSCSVGEHARHLRFFRANTGF